MADNLNLIMYETLDSGKRKRYDSGMRRDDNTYKPDYMLCMPKGIPYEEQMLTRWANLMVRGADKYGERNFELARTQEEYDRFLSSAMRHMIQYVNGAKDEDHAAAVYFNICAAEMVIRRINEASLSED